MQRMWIHKHDIMLRDGRLRVGSADTPSSTPMLTFQAPGQAASGPKSLV
jgi:hypothetical protein